MRIGIIGFGGAGIAHYLNFRCVPGVRITKIFDPKELGRRRATTLAPNLPAYTDIELFWRDLDAVTICSPDSTHADYIELATARGLHVLCEKPLTDSIEGVRRINEAQRRSGRIIAVLHQMRFVPLFSRMKQLIDSGELGRIGYLEGYYVHDLRKRAFAYDEWRRTDSATPMVYAGCHFFDLLRWFLNDEVREIYAAANNLSFPEYPESDLTIATMKFRSGVLAKVIVAFGAAGPQDHSVRVYGTKKTIDNNVIFGEGGTWQGTLHRPTVIQHRLFARSGRSYASELYHQVRSNLPAGLFDLLWRAERILARHPSGEYGARYYPLRLYEHSLACVEAIGDFVSAVRDSRQPLCSVDESSRTVLGCLAAVTSYRTNRPVSVPALEDVL